MTERIKVEDLPEFDASQYLDSDEAVAAYLNDILQTNDPALLAAALGDIARARGMTDIARGAADNGQHMPFDVGQWLCTAFAGLCKRLRVTLRDAALCSGPRA